MPNRLRTTALKSGLDYWDSGGEGEWQREQKNEWEWQGKWNKTEKQMQEGQENWWRQLQREVGIAMVGCEYRKLWKSLEAITETALENTSAMVVITSGYST